MTISIRARLTLWYVAVLALVLAAFSTGVFWVQARVSRSQFDEDLATLAAAVDTAVRSELAESHELAIAAREAREDFNVPNRTIAILDGDGHPVAARWHGFHGANLPAVDPRSVTVATLVQDSLPWRIRMERRESPDGDYIVFVGASETAVRRERRLLAKTLLLGAPLALRSSVLARRRRSRLTAVSDAPTNTM